MGLKQGFKMIMSVEELNPYALFNSGAVLSSTLLGCVSAYVYADHKGLNNSTKFLTKLFPQKSETFYFRTDFMLSVFVGTCIAFVLYSPTTAYQALAAGVGWTAAFNVLKSDKQSAELQNSVEDKG